MVKYALLIGINYLGTQYQLSGCINDVNNIRKALLEKFDFKAENITMLSDEHYQDNKDDPLAPTRRNIIDSIVEIVQELKEGDTLFLHYSGHGTYTRDTSGDETEGRDELICPVDDSFISDDILNTLLVAALPKKAKLICLFDCCHSGTILDLPYKYRYGRRFSRENSGKQARENRGKNVIMISGCRDDQTSADAYINSDYAGAMSSSFLSSIKSLSKGGNRLEDWRWVDLLSSMRRYLKKGGYSQVPQITCTKARSVRSRISI